MASVPLYRKDFQALAEIRAIESGALAANGNQQGAYYLAGYAIECALKACIAKKTKSDEFPPNRKYIEKIYTHDLSGLLEAAGLDKLLDKEIKTNKGLAVNWATVKDWTEESRYAVSGLNGSDLHAAVTGADGVLAWIKQSW